MNEAQRLAYIRSMGIDSYSPAISLASGSVAEPRDRTDRRSPDQISALDSTGDSKPNKTKPATIEQEQTDPPVFKEPSAHKEPSANIPAEEAATFDDRLAQSPQSEVQSTEDDSIPGNTGQEQLRFALQYFVINEQLAVLSEVPYLSATQFDAAVKSLLLAILKALKVEVDELAPPLVFQWPLDVKDIAGVTSAADAISALEGFMSKRAESTDFACLIVFADQCAEMLHNNKARLVPVEKKTGNKPEKTEIVITHSLSAMLKVPSLKKPVWETLRYLEGRLNP